ncbi:MAG TPA: hypothetical protein VFA43_02170 [Gemmatimonadaceae bacterium]|nr:hypothetical protein [Gemmatimonadaceae bacterium]
MTPTLLALLALLGHAHSHWGEVGHRLIGLTAATALPAEMPAFFRDAADQLSYLNPEPDRWRDRAERTLDAAEDNAFAPDHYIDLERVPTGAREEFRLWRAAHDPKTKQWIEARIINDGGILGHYVADGSNPHHTTIHFDGWVGDNPNGYTAAHGFHARFASIFVQTHFAPGDLHVDEAPRIFPSLRQAVLEYVHESVWVTSGQTVETVESVIQHDIAARGGEDKIHALHTVRQTGLLINGKDTSRLVIESKLPDAMRMEITSGGKTLVRGYDGRTGWQKAPGQPVNLMTPAEQKNISHEADLLSGLVDYAAKGNKVTLAGTEQVEGRDAYKVQVMLRDSTTFTYFIDRQTWLPVKWQGGPWETMYRSFIDVGGVKIPSRFETTQRGSTVAPPTVLAITSAVANPKLADSRFSPPADAK